MINQFGKVNEHEEPVALRKKNGAKQQAQTNKTAEDFRLS